MEFVTTIFEVAVTIGFWWNSGGFGRMAQWSLNSNRLYCWRSGLRSGSRNFWKDSWFTTAIFADGRKYKIRLVLGGSFVLKARGMWTDILLAYRKKNIRYFSF